MARKRKKREGDSLMIATFDLDYKPKITRSTELLKQGYNLRFENGVKILTKGTDVIKITEDNND